MKKIKTEYAHGKNCVVSNYKKKIPYNRYDKNGILIKMKTTIEIIRREMLEDDVNVEKQESYLKKAYKEKDIDSFLIALCGWSWKTIQEKRVEE